MNLVAPESITGRITADPNPLPAEGTSSTRLTWETTATEAEVAVEEGDNPEKVLAQGVGGFLDLPWIQAGRPYVFKLYTLTGGRRLLDEVTVTKTAAGRITLSPSLEDDHGTVIHWDITPPAIAEICLVEADETEKVVSRGDSGSCVTKGLRPGTKYLVRLYQRGGNRPLLDEATIYREVRGKLTATPNPLPIDAGSKTLLQWQTNTLAPAEICLVEKDGSEKVVCRGDSGAYEVSGLRAGREYLFRLYHLETPRQLLDEVTVTLADIPWQLLLDRLEGAHNGGDYSPALAAFLARVMPRCLHRKEFPEWFHLWEANGFHVTPVHFYQPIPDSQDLSDQLWEGPRGHPGVELNESMQRHLLCDVFPTFKKEYERIPVHESGDGTHFYLKNGRFEGLDPLLAYGVVRHFRPRRIVEVGSGYSTLLLAQAALANGTTSLHSVEPYPESFLRQGVEGLTSLLVEKVEEVEFSFFDQLEADDILFIDTSHVVRTGGDVNYLFLELLPRLNPGVIVHVHDIFLPLEYPQKWVIQLRRFWTEQYLLQAFLAFNSEFEVLVSSAYLQTYHKADLQRLFPAYAPWQGGSFWMQRRPIGPRGTS